ncbi:MAG: hypothetical protein JWR32_455, partial [Mycobacterium sp.]|nr:hypothetical protein [Mycobacterium sp.]
MSRRDGCSTAVLRVVLDGELHRLRLALPADLAEQPHREVDTCRHARRGHHLVLVDD